MTLLHHRSVINVDILDPAVPTVPCHGEVATLEDEAGQMHVLAYGSALGSYDRLNSRIGILGELELLVSYHEVLGEQGLSLLEVELHVEEVLLAVLHGVLEALECNHLLALGRYSKLVYLTVSHSLTLFEECPCEVVVAEVGEEVLVVHLYLTLLEVLGSCPDVLVVVAHLISVGVVAAVGSDDTVTVEVVVRCGIAAIVATIGEDLLTLLVLVAEALVHEVPDEATLQCRILTDEVPVLLQATDRVTHSVGILALDEGFVGVLAVTLHVVVVGIHGATDIAVAGVAGLLILCGTAVVVSLDPVVGSLEVRTVTGLVTQAPEDDRGVVLEGHHVADVTLQMSLGEGGVLGQRTLTVAHTVALDVGLGYYVETILVAQLIPTGIVGIVAGAHGIDVEFLHDLDILNHALYRYHITEVGIQFVTVGTLEEYGLAIHEHLEVLELYLAEAHLLADSLDYLVTINEFDEEGVEVRSLGSPLGGIAHSHRCLGLALAIYSNRSSLHHLASSILQSVAQGLAGSVVGSSRDLQRTVLVVLVQVGEDEEIIYTYLRTSIHIYLTGDTGEAPEVLVLEV